MAPSSAALLERVAIHLEKTQQLKARVKKAMTYPAAVLVVAGVVCTLLLMHVVPQFQSLFAGVDGELPGFTLGVIALSAILAFFHGLVDVAHELAELALGGLDLARELLVPSAEGPGLDGVMLGRAAYHEPYLLLGVDSRIFGDDTPVRTADQAASDRADDRGNDTAFTATDGAATHAADRCTSQAADWGLGTFDLHRTQGFDGAHTDGLHATRLVTGVGVTGQVRLATSEQHRHRGKGSNQQNRLTHSINSKETDVH